MRTVKKAFAILDLFTENEPWIRLVDIAKKSGLDRSTCHRHLQTLLTSGFVIQNQETKKYTLGPTLVRLARTREAIVPTSEKYIEILNNLTFKTSETSHASLIAGNQIATIGVCNGLHNNRVHVEFGGKINAHATATGLACMAYGQQNFKDQILNKKLVSYTSETITETDEINMYLINIRKCGYSFVKGFYDADVFGIAAPVFGAMGSAIGAIAVATPLSRMTKDLKFKIAKNTVIAAMEATRQEAGITPQSYLDITRKFEI